MTQITSFDLTLRVVLAASMLVLNVYIFVPLGIYLGNPSEFEAGFSQMLISHWQIPVLSWFILLLPLLLPSRVVRPYAALIFALACFTWLQSSLMMWDYGVIDGRGMDFQSFRIFGVLDLLVLAALVFFALRFAGRVGPMINTISAIFILGQVGMAFSNASDHENIWTRELPRTEIPEEFGSISRNRNIFHIILDSAQSDVFLQLIDTAGLRSDFGGFTLFMDNAAVAPHTAFGVPSTFSGELFDGTRSPQQFFSEAVENGVHSRLFETGYSVNLIPQLSMEKGPYTNYFEVPSSYSGSNHDLIQGDTAILMDAALFRISPHYLRVQIYDKGNWLLSKVNRNEHNVLSFREKAFFEDYIDGLDATSNKPAYHFIHLMPPHPPYVTLEDGSYAGKVLANTHDNYLNEMRPMVALLVKLIERLKSLDVYDNSAIIVQGDHGSSVNPVIDGVTVKPCLLRLPALLAIKEPGKKHVLAVSSSKTSLLDIASTIQNLAGHGTASVFELNPAADRRRHYFLYDDNRIDKYWIDGSVFDPKSCTQAGTKAIDTPQQNYAMGTLLQFGVDGNAEGVAGYGWGPQLNGHMWSKAREAALNLQLPDLDFSVDIDLQLQYRTFLETELLPTQNIRIFANGILIKEWVESSKQSQYRTIRIPANAITSNKLNLIFEFPNAESPHILGVGGDKKKLGIAVSSISLKVSQTRN